ncbi:hypothetical protein [Furfurilactobacillus rossiae]|uniref:Uncharacterized protein n=1 Tax=Furfurilactobacillus rossiae DSM 15814 TaxID=1114972 RepID=A0A0R1RA41_9LACO|nr:hypothetical protein [Furfurilactobacillus rossiae]KRL54029.1 hypothetical protein FD35_GL000732 [Furfurilactobacillus rossiae DSM 15814]QFR68191.1 hypothetical protein LR814_13565 [Furfurilactobacillus rossiae]HAT53675.1 hypothetical protein [Lactobacillus sp.]
MTTEKIKKHRLHWPHPLRSGKRNVRKVFNVGRNFKQYTANMLNTRVEDIKSGKVDPSNNWPMILGYLKILAVLMVITGLIWLLTL